MKAWPALSIETASRAVTTGITLLGLGCFALAWQRLHRQPAGRATLLLALLPLTQPFTGMAYTDWPALAFLFAAWWAQLTGRYALAALVFAGAVMIRQTNLSWLAFFFAWEFWRTDEPRSTLWRRLGWLIGLTLVAGATIAWTGRLTMGSQHGNDFRFNIAAVHFGAILLLVLGLPLWLAQFAPLKSYARSELRLRPRRALAVAVAGLAVAGVLALTFRNPHIWNRELFWEGCSFTLLRNWPLVWIDTHPWLRVVSGLNLVLMALAIGRLIHAQRLRRPLWIALAVGCVPVVTNSLVEPRYFIPLAGMMLCLVEFDLGTWRRLAVWWGLLAAAHAPLVARALSLW
jgi:alpha-1,2-glucosyltransferase